MTETAKITLEEMKQMIGEAFQQKAKIADLNAQLKEENKKLSAMKIPLMNALKQLGQKAYESAFGEIKIKQKYSVKIPANEEAKKAFFDWLNEKNIFMQYVSVHSRTLNKLYNTELEEAKRRGMGMEFSIPGIEAPSLYEDLEIKKNGESDESNSEE